MCIYTRQHLCIYCRYICIYIYIYTHSQFIGMYTCRCTNTSSACSYICNMYTHKHLCIYCRYTCTYIYIYTHSRFIGMYTCKCTYKSSASSYICNIVVHENSFHPTYRDKKDRNNKNEDVGSEVQFQFKHSSHCHEQHTVMNDTLSRTTQRSIYKAATRSAPMNISIKSLTNKVLQDFVSQSVCIHCLVSFAKYRLFCRALLQKRPIILF